jgi:type I restriction-modification system DNA methylase subunit
LISSGGNSEKLKRIGANVMARAPAGLSKYQKVFTDDFGKLTHRHNGWQVWEDFVTMAACSISNSFDTTHFEQREKLYMDRFGRYEAKETELFPKLLATTVNALDEDPEQDFLGALFQLLELSNHWKGQFFTPYSVCRMMAEMQLGGITEAIKEKGYVSVNDPACGAGALLMAFANACKAKEINYQNHVLFVAQDIDQTAALMCYLQLSLLGSPGYVVVADTLRYPTVTAETEVWYTPMYNSQVWRWRRAFGLMDVLRESESTIFKETIPEVMEPKILRTMNEREEEKVLQLTLF